MVFLNDLRYGGLSSNFMSLSFRSSANHPVLRCALLHAMAMSVFFIVKRLIIKKLIIKFFSM